MENPPMRPAQTTFADARFEAYYKPTRREQFLAEMDRAIPWQELCTFLDEE